MVTSTIEVPSKSRENVTHTLTIYNGRAVGCSCDYRTAMEKYNVFTACGHMKSFNAPKPVIEQKQDQFPELDSCGTCGRLIKKGTMTCARCLGC